MKAIELFAGIGGFRLACDAKGIHTIFANDIKPTACSVYVDKFGESELRIGDLSEYMSEIPQHDLLTGGFPCQPFSSAGKKRGIRDPRGTLFEKIVDVLTRCRPEYFVLENVKRLLSMENGEHFATILDKLSILGYCIEWRLLNAMDFGLPQNRQRIFITGIRIAGAPQYVRLVRKTELEELPNEVLFKIRNYSSWASISDHGKAFPNWGLAYQGRFSGASINNFAEKMPSVLLKDVLQDEVPPEFDFTDATKTRMDQSKVIQKYVQGVEIISNQEGGARMGYTIFGTNGVAPTLTASSSRHYERYRIGNKYRRLTNVEYARIQGFPDDHCRAATVYTQYELIGNAVPPQMASWVIGRLLNDGIAVPDHNTTKQMEIFEYAE